jgi:hypothetical protein
LFDSHLIFKMYIFVNAMDYGKVLTIPCQPYDTVSSVKTKIELAMGGPGSVPEDIIDSLNYLGTTLSCVNTLASYGIKDSAYLNMGKALIKKPDPKAPQTQPQPQAQQPQYGYPVNTFKSFIFLNIFIQSI